MTSNETNILPTTAPSSSIAIWCVLATCLDNDACIPVIISVAIAIEAKINCKTLIDHNFAVFYVN